MGTLFVAGNDATPALLNQYYGFADANQNAVTSGSLGNLSTVYQIPANEPVAGSSYELACGGSGTWGSTQTALSFVPSLGGTSLFNNVTIAAAAFSASASFRWQMRFVVVCATNGAGGTWFGSLMGTVTEVANNVLPGTVADNTVPIADADAGAVSISTTSAMNVVLKAMWGSGADAATITCRHTIFRKIA